MKKLDLKHEFRETSHLAWPVVLGHMGHMVISTADSLMIGNIGSVYLSAATVANSLFFIVFVIGMGITMAMTPLAAEAKAGNNPDRCAAIWQNGLVLNIVSALFLTIVTFLSAEIIPYLDQDPLVTTLSVKYLRIIAISVFPIMFFMHNKHFLEGLSWVKPAMYVMVIIVVLNVLLNYLFIYGIGPFPRMELNGAGYATLISRVVGWGLLYTFIRKSSIMNEIPVHWKGFKVSKEMILKILSLGLPIALQYVFEVGAFAASAIMVGWVGYREQAAHNIALNLASISYSIAIGFSAAATIRVSDQRGKGNWLEMRYAGYGSILSGTMLMVLCGVIFALGRYFFPAFYTHEIYVIEVAASLMIVASIFQLSDGVQGVCVGALRGLEDVKVPAAITFIAYWIIAIPTGYILGFTYDWGAVGIWTGLTAGLTSSALFLMLRFAFLSSQIKKLSL